MSEELQQWLAKCGLTPERMINQLEPMYTPLRKVNLYHCDHRGLPLALIDINGHIAWSAESDEWGNVLREDNQHNLQQLIRLPGQQWDKESGLYYNRHRYYDPAQGRYITQDPVGLEGGWNLYQYPLNPIQFIDPRGLKFLVEGDRKDFDTAINFLKKDTEMARIITAIENNKKVIITVSCNNGKDNSFSPWTGRIHWDPHSALLCDENPKNGHYDFKNGTQVPALALGHEIAHAYAFSTETYKNYMTRTNAIDPIYDTAEEKRVITGAETHAAKSLKQCIRKNHGG
ncbi:RHS repeat protein, partial [Salmonella enterica]|nr:RHS repeat protein [Salmonella enterica]EDZ7239244.1 RHS repeat protein [Salmonella enterica]EGI2097679.1 RHS repeat protein [Salmonella enterica]